MPRWCLCPDRRLVGMYVPKTEAAGTQRKPRQLAVSVARDRIKNISFLFMWNAKIVLWQGIITLPNDEGFLLLSLKEKTIGDFVVIFLIQMASFDFSYRRIGFYSKKIDDSICVSCSDPWKAGREFPFTISRSGFRFVLMLNILCLSFRTDHGVLLHDIDRVNHYRHWEEEG